jgi:hypothetical protein
MVSLGFLILINVNMVLGEAEIYGKCPVFANNRRKRSWPRGSRRTPGRALAIIRDPLGNPEKT